MLHEELRKRLDAMTNRLHEQMQDIEALRKALRLGPWVCDAPIIDRICSRDKDHNCHCCKYNDAGCRPGGSYAAKYYLCLKTRCQWEPKEDA